MRVRIVMLAVLILGLGICAGIASAAAPGTITVGLTGCDYTSIQAAIEAANEGDTISVEAGTYRENLKIEKDMTVQGSGEEQIIIKGKKCSYPVIWITSPKEIKVKVEGLKIREAYGRCADLEKRIYATGILIQGAAQVMITDSSISENWVDGIVLMDSAQVTITDSSVSENWVDGISLGGSAQATITNSTISGNNSGISLGGSAQATITDSSVSENEDNGISLWGSAQATITDSSVSENEDDGISLGSSAQVTITNSSVSENGGDGISLGSSAQAAIEENKIIKNKGYGVALDQRPCHDTDSVFSGRVSGKGNTVPVPGEPDGNGEGAVCPSPELDFLTTEEGGEYQGSQ